MQTEIFRVAKAEAFGAGLVEGGHLGVDVIQWNVRGEFEDAICWVVVWFQRYWYTTEFGYLVQGTSLSHDNVVTMLHKIGWNSRQYERKHHDYRKIRLQTIFAYAPSPNMIYIWELLECWRRAIGNHLERFAVFPCLILSRTFSGLPKSKPMSSTRENPVYNFVLLTVAFGLCSM